MTTYTYEQIYADACKGIIRSEADASLAGRHNGADCVVVVDRKCGECTPSVTYYNVIFEKTSPSTTIWAWSDFQDEPHTCDVVIRENGVDITVYVKATFVGDRWRIANDTDYYLYSDANATTIYETESSSVEFVSMNGGYTWMSSDVSLSTRLKEG